ncbi:hypothetical protein NPX13_g9077 [Xylaria arbuscula]|uniref:F-box domain-containing protein n=1 Tax=Xylaria arbuscula TaxID=114810 RepID=A0A9W8TJ84_9PEZI|nr:hypothetical protein NPX13_g9077 [Xylaria arbuscula]
MTSDLDPDALAAGLVKAKAYYNEKQYAKASSTFKQVRLPPTLLFHDNATVVSGHLDALDGLAAVYEARGLSDIAIIIAEAMINLAPREPKGYLRLGRLLRLQHSFHPAFMTYKQGIMLVSKKNPSHPLLSTLRQMETKVRYSAVATDPFTVLPLELVAMILKNTDFRSLCRCLRVSKSWKTLLTTKDAIIQSLWRAQHFNRCTKPVRAGHLQKYATYAGGQVTELVIGDCHRFGVNLNTFQWIASCRSLQVLNLGSPMPIDIPDYSSLLNTPCRPQLTSLYFGFKTPFMVKFLHKIVTSSATTLQELTILNFPSRTSTSTEGIEDVNWPVLLRLRVLRLGSPPSVGMSGIDLVSFTPDPSLSLTKLTKSQAPFVHTSPNAEEVWLEGGCFEPGDWQKQPSSPWPHLKKLFIGRHFINPPFLLPPDLEELHLMSILHVRVLLITQMFQDPAIPITLNLRKLTLRDHLPNPWLSYMESWIRTGLESGRTTELGMAFPKPLPHWLRSEHLKFLSLKGLSIEFGADPYALEEAFVDLLDRFPNLEGLDVGQEPLSNTALAKAVRRGVKLIYHRGDYNQRTEVREWALKEYKARIVEGDYALNLPIYPRDDPYSRFY